MKLSLTRAHPPSTPRVCANAPRGGVHARVNMTQPREIWTLDFRAEGDGPPVEIRVRRLLKRALRSFGLRCVDYRLASPAATADAGRPIVEARP